LRRPHHKESGIKKQSDVQYSLSEVIQRVIIQVTWSWSSQPVVHISHTSGMQVTLTLHTSIGQALPGSAHKHTLYVRTRVCAHACTHPCAHTDWCRSRRHPATTGNFKHTSFRNPNEATQNTVLYLIQGSDSVATTVVLRDLRG